MNIKRGLLRLWIVFFVVWGCFSVYIAPPIMTATHFNVHIPIFKTNNQLTIPVNFDKQELTNSLSKVWDNNWSNQQTTFQKTTAQKQLGTDVEILLQANVPEEIIARYIKNSPTISHRWDMMDIPKAWAAANTKEQFISVVINKANKQIKTRKSEQLDFLKMLILPPAILLLSAYSLLWAFAGFKRKS